VLLCALQHRAARVAASAWRHPGQRRLAAEGRVPAEAEASPDGEVVRVGELGGRGEREARGGVAISDGGGGDGARERVVEARVVLLGGLGRRRGRHGNGGG